MQRPTDEMIAELRDKFCNCCARLPDRNLGKCPKKQSTCGAQIDQVYQLKQPYAVMPVGSLATIKDIFWSIDQDYATVTISNEKNQRFGVTHTILTKYPS